MSQLAEDQATAVRGGEELDSEALAAYLREHLGLDAGSLSVKQFGSGYSNLTYLLASGGCELVLRRPPFGANIKGGHDMGREYRILRRLEAIYAKAPRALLYCDDPAVIGAPFYIMQRVKGVILRSSLPMGAAPDPATAQQIGGALVDTLADLHSVDYAAAGLAELGRPEGYVARQVHGWSQRYTQARTHDVPDMVATADWLTAHLPVKAHHWQLPPALIHNDFKLDNVVLNPDALTQVVAVLDWEMATIGDPLMDLGTMLAYWIEPDDPPVLQRIGLGPLPGGLRRSQVAARYARQRSLPIADFGEQLLPYYVFGLFKVAVIAQQIYGRYRQGFTRDARFVGLDAVVAACAAQAAQAIRSGHLTLGARD